VLDRLLMAGRTEVVDADLARFFDTIPHTNLLRLVARRIVDRGVLNLIKQWLRAPAIEPADPKGSAGRKSTQGTPQGGVISPLLANLYHGCIAHLWQRRGHAQRLGGVLVSYADDFVIALPPGNGAAALDALRGICTRLCLELNEDKTRVVDALTASFAFLGFTIQKVLNPKTDRRFVRTVPSPKSEQRLRTRLREITSRWRGRLPVAQIAGEMNRVLRGWGQYFHFGNPQQAMARLNHFAEERLRKWLMRRRQRRGPGYSQHPAARLYGAFGLHRLPTARPPAPANASGRGGTLKAVCGKSARTV
jgi:RNA-directed DNA polymerase